MPRFGASPTRLRISETRVRTTTVHSPPPGQPLGLTLSSHDALGSIIESIVYEGPAWQGGLRAGDILVSLGGCSEIDAIEGLIGTAPPGAALVALFHDASDVEAIIPHGSEGAAAKKRRHCADSLCLALAAMLVLNIAAYSLEHPAAGLPASSYTQPHPRPSHEWADSFRVAETLHVHGGIREGTKVAGLAPREGVRLAKGLPPLRADGACASNDVVCTDPPQYSPPRRITC
jgi:hypothetical protein